MIFRNRCARALARRPAFLVVCLVLLAAGAPLGADCSLTSTGNLPLPDLGPSLHQGLEGGLYAGGANFIPAAHLAEGLDRAVTRVVPRAPDGSIDRVNGAIVMISVGMSNTSQEFISMNQLLEADPAAVNPRLVVINGSQGGEPAASWVDPNAPTWQEIDRRLGRYDPRQVQVAWVKQANGGAGPFPDFALDLQGKLEAIARNLKTNYPNLALAFFSSRTRAYTDDQRVLSPEPTAYETGFAVKWMIENQILGTGNVGLDVAPWLSWGPYIWADGLVARSDGFIWECSDTVADFIHPSMQGRQKIAQHLLAFFKTDPTTRSWFLKTPAAPPTIDLAEASPASGQPPLQVQFTALASDPDGIAEYLWTFGDGTFSTDQSPLKSFAAAGQHQAHLTVIDGLGNASFVDLPVTVGEGRPFELRVNAGGTDFTAAGGELFVAEFGAAGGRTATFSEPVSGTVDDPLYQTIRGGSFSYGFSVPDGDYQVTLYLTEPFLQDPGRRIFDITAEGRLALDDFDIVAASGGRLVAHEETFSASVADGELNLSFEPVAGSSAIVSAIAILGTGAAPGAEPDISAPANLDFGSVLLSEFSDRMLPISNDGDRDLEVTGLVLEHPAFTVISPPTPFTVAPGGPSVDVLLRFRPGEQGTRTAKLAILSDDPDESPLSVALLGEGVTAPPAPDLVLRINSGGEDFTAANGDLFVADKAFLPGDFGAVGGATGSVSSAVAGTSDDPLFQTLRGERSFAYLFDALPAGDYRVTLYFNEPSFSDSGSRLFDVAAEGVVVLDDFDIVAAAGAPRTAHTESFVVTLSDGRLDLDFDVVGDGRALVSALAVERLR